MSIRVSCPSCQAGAGVEEQSLGRRGRCKKCGHVFVLARPGGEATSAASGDTSAWRGSSSSSYRVSLPEQFGRYRIMRQLGQGGMGAVYLAHDVRLDRQVALKIPYFNPSDGPHAILRFEREARAVATLDHPNICPIFDVGEVDGIHFLTMPYIEGKPLSDAMGRDRTVTEAQATAAVRKLALALQHAHDKGVIHRDFKPGNIMVNRRREMIIMDFGLARLVDNDDKPVTREGHVLGTALYMAPEQAIGDLDAVGPVSDVYSLGVILYELLTGLRPFEGPWLLVIGRKTVMDPSPPSQHRPDLSSALDAICLKAIAKDPRERYATMAEFAEALAVFLASPVASPIKGSSHAANIYREGTASGEESVPQVNTASAGVPPWLTPRARIVASAATAALMILGIATYVIMSRGNTTLEGDDPKVAPGLAALNPEAPKKPDEPMVLGGKVADSGGTALPEKPDADSSMKPADGGADTKNDEKPAVKDYTKALQGVWYGISQIKFGEDISDEIRTQNWTTERKGNQFVTKVNGQFWNRGTWSVDATKDPMEITLVFEEGVDAGETKFGIFKLEGDEMIMCHGDTLPDKFESLPGQGRRLVGTSRIPPQ